MRNSGPTVTAELGKRLTQPPHGANKAFHGAGGLRTCGFSDFFDFFRALNARKT